jgi:phosphomannomutase
MGRLFGTDGVRGLANGELLTPELALALAGSAARELGAAGDGRRLRAAVGRDTRPSGPLLEAAAAAGFAAAGIDVELLGVVPTPAVAHACASGAVDLGLMISASHNPMPDNGLKLFGPGGQKLPDAVEDAVEAGLSARPDRPTGTGVGAIRPAPAGRTEDYLEHLLSTLEAPLAVCALGLRERGRLAGDTVVATVMSNLGFVLAMREHGIEVVRTAVGDRYVLEAMRAGGHSLGGEQSGHVVFADAATTGDGLLTALALMGRVAATGRSLAELAAVVQVLPQVLVNVRADRSRATADDVLAAVGHEEAALGDTGRVLLRPSGTEPVVRVMVEAPSQQQADEVAHRLATVVQSR